MVASSISTSSIGKPLVSPPNVCSYVCVGRGEALGDMAFNRGRSIRPMLHPYSGRRVFQRGGLRSVNQLA